MLKFVNTRTKLKQPNKDLYFELSRMMVPRDSLEYFEVFDVRELPREWQVTLHEKGDQIPKAGQDIRYNNEYKLTDSHNYE